ncbi:MAG: diguanylate cyclase [Armatimonadota bacterium]
MAPQADRIERRLAALETVQETAWILSSVRDRAALAELALDAMLRASSARAAVLALAEGGQLRAVAASAGSEDLLSALGPLALESLRTVRAVEERKITRRSLRLDAAPEELRRLAESGIRGVCNVPLRTRRQCLGAVLLLYDSGRGLGSEATRPLRILARQVAAALRNIEQFEQLKEDVARAHSRLAAMTESARILADTTDPEAVAQRILMQIRAILPCEAAWLILLDRDGENAEAVAHRRPDGFLDATPSMELHAISRWCIETGLPFLVNDPRAHTAFCEDLAGEMGRPVRNALCVPLAFGDTVLGTIEFANTEDGRPFSNEDIETLAAFASQAALVVENALLLQETRELAIRDSLTDLYNRRHLLDTLEREVARHRRYGTDLSLIIIDVDDFKQINDTRGHPAGDAVLQMLARTLAESLRDVDIVARLGGDEFAVLLPNTGLDGALHVARRLRRLVLEAEAPGTAAGLKVSVSQGASEASPGNADDASDLLAEADTAMYEAKAAGNGLIAAHGRGIVEGPETSEAPAPDEVASAPV